jgi:hypothetical protein
VIVCGADIVALRKIEVESTQTAGHMIPLKNPPFIVSRVEGFMGVSSRTIYDFLATL